jgi:signal peptidase I
MALAFSGLSAYTKQLIKPLLTSAVFGARTQELIMSGGIVLPNIKSVAAIPLLDTDAVFATQSCSFDASGTTTFSQRTITVGKIKVEEKLCPKDMEAYFTQEALKAGSTYEDFGNAEFQKVFLDKKNARIASQLETAIWQGDATGAVANLNKFDGLQKLIAAGSPVDANVSGYTGITGSAVATVTQSNVIACTEGIYKAIPVAILSKGDVKIFVGDDWYRLLIMAYRALNLFAYNPQDKDARSFVLPGTSIEIIPVNGLNTTGDAYAMSLSNMVLAVDLVDEENSYRMWYSEDNNDVRYRVEFKMGVNVAFTNEVVKFISAI